MSDQGYEQRPSARLPEEIAAARHRVGDIEAALGPFGGAVGDVSPPVGEATEPPGPPVSTEHMEDADPSLQEAPTDLGAARQMKHEQDLREQIAALYPGGDDAA